MDEDGKRKRIDITDDEQSDGVTVATDGTPGTDSFGDAAPSSVGSDIPEASEEEKVITIDSSFEEPEENTADESIASAAVSEELPAEAAEPAAAQVAMVETEIEPETVATTRVEQEPATVADRPNAFIALEEPVIDTPVAMAPIGGAAPQKSNRKRLILIAAGAGLCIILAILTWWLLTSKKESPAPVDDTTPTATTPVEQPKLGIAATITEGIVEYMQGEAEWQAMTPATTLGEGDSVRTGDDSRAVLTLDDGSAIRLDANTTIKLTSLTANQVQVEHLDGIAYSRIVPSTDRTFTVTVDGATYQALGTAFATIKNETDNGVRVFQSSVRVNGSSDAVAEGKQFFQSSRDEKLQGLVSDINIDDLVDDTFINWNVSLDEKDNNFKDRLGVLPKIKERAIEKKKQREAAKLKAEKEAAEKKAKQEAEEKAKRDKQAQAGLSARAMTLKVGKENLLEWNYLGKATNGDKLVYSKENTSPAFQTDTSQSISSAGQTSAHLSSKLKGKYYVRVCAYTKDTTCVDYSNVVIINI